jgi:acyl-coenzyme A thioesterase PaaI-like protein
MTPKVIEILQRMIDAPDPARAPPYVAGMGFADTVRFIHVEVGLFVLEWDVTMAVCHNDGIALGGVINVIADMGQPNAFWSTSTERESYSTADFHTRFYRPIKAGQTIRVENRVINRSKRIGVVESRFIGPEGKLHATVSGSWMLTKRAL